ncbi:hypothetical protein HDV03_002177 [Kappamyces sp. JEL0829]|nr:hypothetical protein HDV03_002177 [Kappamyces sp. JEL0829]
MQHLVLLQDGDGKNSAALQELPLLSHEEEAGLLSEGFVCVALYAAALNHRDLYILQGKYPGIQPTSTLGADGAGIVCRAKAPGLLGTRVLINSSIGWREDMHKPEDIWEFGILGMKPLPGTFASQIWVRAEYCFSIPDSLSFCQASAIPLAGLTAFRALVTLGRLSHHLDRNGANPTSILIPGIGGGVACWALQFAVALGAQVWVTSSSQEKIEQACQLGAKGGVLYTLKDHVLELEQRAGLFDIIVDGSSGPNLKSWVRLIKPGGDISVYGAVAGSQSTITVPFLWFKHVHIHGSCMGSNAEFRAMMDIIREKKLQPVVSRIFHGLSSYREALDYLASGKQLGKVVIEIRGEPAKL